MKKLLPVDQELLKGLSKKARAFPSAASARLLANNLEKLKQGGSLKIHFSKLLWQDIDRERRWVTLARAAITDMWPMGTNYWVRDNSLIAARYLFSPFPAKEKTAYLRLGKELLLSNLTLISSQTQLARFRRIISAKSAHEINNQNLWPHIFFGIKDNLNAARDEAWAHKQDAWQILAFCTLKACREGLLTTSELSPKHKQFLGLIAPFLAKVKFYQQENSGSWEELTAVRSSVLSWEIALLHQISSCAVHAEFSFLLDGFRTERKHIVEFKRVCSLPQLCAQLIEKGVRAILTMLPYESPGYSRRDVRYRAADAALYYLLELDFPCFLGAYLGWEPKRIQALEASLVKQVLSLSDPLTGGICRYLNDSYQRVGYFRYQTIAQLAKMYGAPSGDASRHFKGRDAVVPKGREAAWVHFVWQMAAWAGRCYVQTGQASYRKLRDQFLRRGLSLLTRSNEWTLEQAASGKVSLARLPARRLPECWISEKWQGRDIVFPSPHTPLNWASAEAISAIAWYQRGRGVVI